MFPLMKAFRNICLVHGSGAMVSGFKALGCTVVNLIPDAPFFHLPTALAEQEFTPDLVVQTETLGQRSLLTGIEEMDCPVLFWAIDPHLNGHWHPAYARLFDLTCSTQRKWVHRLRERGAPDVRWLPIHGFDFAWTDMAERGHDVAFVGRITEQRPARKWMVEFLEQKSEGCKLAVEQNLKFGDMITLYRDSRIAPNESILGEVNFRLFEAASCGCLVLSQDLGDEQEALFEKGREFDTYSHVVELEEKLDTYLKNDRLVQTMARAARARVHAEHLPMHRAERILEYAQDAVTHRATGAEAAKWIALSAYGLWEGGHLKVSARDILSRLEKLEQDEDVVTATLRVQAISGMKRLMGENLNMILGGELYPDSMDLNFTGSVAALSLGNWDGAKAFWYRHLQAAGNRVPELPSDPSDLLMLWSKDLNRTGRTFRAGFTFDPAFHLPGSAVECLLKNLADNGDHLPSLRLLDSMLRPHAGFEHVRVGFLSIQTLHEQNDWRLAFEIALADLKSYRLESGLEELMLARELARKQGREKDFDRALSARDGTGLLAARLNG